MEPQTNACKGNAWNLTCLLARNIMVQPGTFIRNLIVSVLGFVFYFCLELSISGFFNPFLNFKFLQVDGGRCWVCGCWVVGDGWC